MSHIVEFFENKVPDSEGRMIDDILYESDFWLESTHDWVQWLFPLTEPSNFNPNAPLLTDQDIDFFNSPQAKNVAANYIAGIQRMLEFLGLIANSSSGLIQVDIKDYPTLTNGSEEKLQRWVGKFNHNHLRITRMLKSMMLLGFADYARAIYDFMTEFEIEPLSKEYWTKAVSETD